MIKINLEVLGSKIWINATPPAKNKSLILLILFIVWEIITEYYNTPILWFYLGKILVQAIDTPAL